MEIFGGRAPSLGAPKEPEYRRGPEPTQISGEYPPHHPRPTALEERPHHGLISMTPFLKFSHSSQI